MYLSFIWSHYGNTINYMHVGRCLLVHSWFDPIPCWVLSWVPIAYVCWTAPSNQMCVFGFCRTAVNAQSGVRTPAAGIITGKRPSPLTLPAYGSSSTSVTRIHDSFLSLGAWDLAMWPEYLDRCMRCVYETWVSELGMRYETWIWDVARRSWYETCSMGAEYVTRIWDVSLVLWPRPAFVTCNA